MRGFRRLKLRFFGGDVVAAAATYGQAKLDRLLAAIATKVDRPHREAALVLRGLHPAVVPAACRAASSTARRPARRSSPRWRRSAAANAVALPMKVDAAEGDRRDAGAALSPRRAPPSRRRSC